jgi:hypothetical protein
MPHDWRSATLLQARSDYDMLRRLLGDEDVPICQTLHCLQMTTEKLAKGFLTRSGQRYPNTHDAFAKFVRVAKGLPEFRIACGFHQADQFRRYMESLQPLAQAVENLSPDGGDHPNPEYPWESSGTIIAPMEHSFAGFSLQSPAMLKLLTFIETCFKLAR